MIGIALICGQGLCCLFSNRWMHYQSLCLTFVVSLVPSEDVLYFEHFFLLWIISFIAAPGLGNQVEALARKGSAEFNVRVYQENGEVVRKPPHQVLLVDKMRIKLLKGRCTKVKEASPTVCL
jgi:hypothetical protein